MIKQQQIVLRRRPRGFHLITDEIVSQLPQLPETGLLHLFLQHTSAALSLNENADPDVRHDLDAVFNRLVRENEPYYTHTLEGEDDMPAHVKSSLVGASLLLPITHGRLNLGRWQGIYLCEFRSNNPARQVVATILGDSVK